MGRKTGPVFDFRPVIKSVGLKEIINQAGPKELIEEMGIEKAIDEVGLEKVAVEKIVARLTEKQKEDMLKQLQAAR